MKLYLIRHAQAFPKSEDPEGHLTPLGEKTALEVGKFLNKFLESKISHVYYSHKTRAKETAQLIVSQFQFSLAMSEVDGLQPMDDPLVWKGKLSNLSSDILLVSHIPYVNNLAQVLLKPSDNSANLQFKPGTCIVLEQYSPEHWVINYEFSPEL